MLVAGLGLAVADRPRNNGKPTRADPLICPGPDKRQHWADNDQRGADKMSSRRCQRISTALTKMSTPALSKV